jgi:hypothetical protein
LPNVELFVLLDGFIHLVGLESFVGASVDHVAHLHPFVVARELLDDGEDAIARVSWPENYLIC